MLRLVLCVCLVATVCTQQTTREGGEVGRQAISPPQTLSPLVPQDLSLAQLQQQPRIQELLTLHQREQTRRLREEARRRQERRRQQEQERQRQLDLRREELERQRQLTLQQELERQRQLTLQQELERQRQLTLQQELERQRQLTLQQELERQRQLTLRQQQAELELRRAQAQHIPILEDRREGPYQDGTYYFTYTTGNGIQREERGTPTGPNTLEVTGFYSYTAPNGEVITMEYIANEYGYRAFPVHSDGLATSNRLRPLPIPAKSSNQ